MNMIGEKTYNRRSDYEQNKMRKVNVKRFTTLIYQNIKMQKNRVRTKI